jgi:hypothetical protein
MSSTVTILKSPDEYFLHLLGDLLQLLPVSLHPQFHPLILLLVRKQSLQLVLDAGLLYEWGGVDDRLGMSLLLPVGLLTHRRTPSFAELLEGAGSGGEVELLLRLPYLPLDRPGPLSRFLGLFGLAHGPEEVVVGRPYLLLPALPFLDGQTVAHIGLVGIEGGHFPGLQRAAHLFLVVESQFVGLEGCH